MSEPSETQHYPSAHVAWLACLYLLLHKIHTEGSLSIEGDIESAEHPDSIFQKFPQTAARPYREFACDVLRMILMGDVDVAEMQVYVDHYIGGLMAKEGVFSGAGADESLLRTIWIPLWALMKGNAPQTACEFGRQAIPVKIKPSFIELETLLRKIGAEWRQRGRKSGESGLDAEVDAFIASLD